MRTAHVQVFTIEELSEEAQDRAIDWLRTEGWFDPSSSELLEEFKEHLAGYGLPNENVEFSLGYSQGDGVAFYGPIDIPVLLKRLQKEEYNEFIEKYDISANIERNSYGYHYSHWNTMDVYLERGVEYDTKEAIQAGHDLWEILKDTVVQQSRRMESSGYKKFEACQEKEYIIECAVENDYEFTATGKFWRD